MMNLNFNNLERGSTLIESLLALAFAVMIITAVVIAVITALNSATFNKNQNLATQIAQEGIDIARYMKTSNYAGFFALLNGGGYCPVVSGNKSGTLEQVGDGGCEFGNFTKEVFINHSGLDQNNNSRCQPGSSFVASTVSWTDSKCEDGDYCHKVQLDTCLADLDQLKNL